MTGHARLTPDELDRHPQLAVLFALDAALWAARMALISDHAELREFAVEADTGSKAALARSLIRLFDDTGALLTAYRHALERPSQTPLSSDDVTF